MLRRSLSIVLALACSLPAQASVRAAPAADVDARAEALFNEARYLEAAQVFVAALAEVEEGPGSRARRNTWATGAVNAYRQAFAAVPTMCSVTTDGLALADRYLEGLISAYGEAVASSDEYVGMRELRTELDQERARQGCAAPAAAPEPAPEAAPPPVTVAPEVVEPPPPPRRDTRGLVVGVGVAAALGVAAATASVVTYLQVRKPGGAAYRDIHDAAVASGVANDANTDMCVAGREVEAVASACDRWSARRQGFIATAVLAGVFTATAAALTGVLIHQRRRAGPAVARLRRHALQLGATPLRGGASFTAGLRF